MVVKQFKCDHCGAEGKVVLKGTDVTFEEIVNCPVCGSDIFEEEDDVFDRMLDDDFGL